MSEWIPILVSVYSHPWIAQSNTAAFAVPDTESDVSGSDCEHG